MEQNSPANSSKLTLREKLLSEGIIIGFITVMGYFCAFCYEAGSCSVFKIPLSLISLTVTNIFIAIIFVTASLLPLFWAAEFISLLGINTKTFIGRRILFYVFISIFALFFMILTEEWKGWAKFLLFVVIGYGFLDFIFPLLTQRKVKGYPQKLEAQEQTDYYHDQYSLFNKFTKRYGRSAMLLVIVFSFLPYISYLVGKGLAKHDTEFLIIKSNGNPNTLVVLKSYSNKLIAAPLITGQKKIKPQFYIIELGSKEIILEPVKIGPLSLEETAEKETKKK